MTSYAKLPEDHKRFVDSYVHCLNFRKAYQDAYPLVTDWACARQGGSRLAATPLVKEAIAEQLKQYTLEKAEVLKHYIELLQFDVTDYQYDNGELNVAALKTSGYGWMLKAVKPNKFGTEYILMDKDRALESLAKIHQLFNDNQTVNVNINQEISAKQQLESKLKELDKKLNQYDGD